MISVVFDGEDRVDDYVSQDDAEGCAFSAVHVAGTAERAAVFVDGNVVTEYDCNDEV